jgi:acyl-CoA thioesterase-2
MAALIDALYELESTGPLAFRATLISGDEQRAFGGVLLAQSLAAASRTVDTGPCHSLHALFSAPAAVDRPLDIKVVPIRNGSRFASRRIEAYQREKLILSAIASFHAGDAGPVHAVTMPDLPPPESLPERGPGAASRPRSHHYITDLVLDVRPLEATLDDGDLVQARRAFWFKPREGFRNDSMTRRAVLAFASDLGLVSVGVRRQWRAANGEALQAVSLDHAIWFHRDPPVSDWLAHVQHTTIAVDGRGMTHGEIFTRDGLLVATTAQEILCRQPKVAIS